MMTRWNPFRDILNIQDRMNRIFQDDMQGNEIAGTGEWLPPVDIYETDTEIVILAELPGTPEDTIDVQISDGVLTIKGVKPSPLEKGSDTYYRIERTSGRFARSFAIPSGIEASTVQASIKDGILRVVLTKSAAAAPRSIKVTKRQDAE